MSIDKEKFTFCPLTCLGIIIAELLRIGTLFSRYFKEKNEFLVISQYIWYAVESAPRCCLINGEFRPGPSKQNTSAIVYHLTLIIVVLYGDKI